MDSTMEDDDEMIMIIVGDVDANDNHNQGVEPIPPMPMPIKEEQINEEEEYDESNLDPDSILETAELHGQYITFIKKEDQSIQEEYFEYDYLDDLKKENESSSEEEELETSDAQKKPRQSYIKQLRNNFPKMRKDAEYLVAHLTELMKQTKPPMPPIDFCRTVKKMLVCAYCGVESATLPVACRHYQKKHGTRYLTCYACGATFKCTTGLYKHEKRCSAEGANLVLRARGRYLGRKGRTRPFLTRHKFDPWGEKGKGEPKRLFCSVCPASFRNGGALRSHELMHRGERPYQCDQCPHAYTSAIALRRHLQIHANREYTCDICGRSFRVKTTLIVHMNTHLPQRKHPCDRCERRFAQKHALQHHINRDHLNIPPPLVCAACPKRFPRVSNLNAHMKAKHGLTVMTRRMFFKALPSMQDTELKQATVVFNAHCDNVFAVSTNKTEPIAKGSNDQNIKKETELDEESMNCAEMFDVLDGNVKEVVVNTTNEVETVPKKAVVKTSLNSCELEFASFIARDTSPAFNTHSRIPRVDLSLARGAKQNISKENLLRSKFNTHSRIPRVDLSLARGAKQNILKINLLRSKETPKVDEMHKKIKETCGRIPDLITDNKEIKTEKTDVNEPLYIKASVKANVVNEKKPRNKNFYIKTKSKAASQVNLSSKKKK